jgi:hypothetical protein
MTGYPLKAFPQVKQTEVCHDIMRSCRGVPCSDRISLMRSRLNGLKKNIFYEMLDMAGRVFIVARYSEDVVIGNRGFTEEEKRNGIVLVFNKSMNFTWDDFGISSTLVFGTSPQKCFVPLDHIVAIYSPELRSQFITSSEIPGSEETGEKAGPNVVQVDFTKKKASRRPKSGYRRGRGKQS